MACGFVLRQSVIGTYIGSGYPFVPWGFLNKTLRSFETVAIT